MRYTAPQHTADATISTGLVTVDKKGILNVPDVLDSDHAGLVRSGFVPIPDEAPVAETETKPPAATPPKG